MEEHFAVLDRAVATTGHLVGDTFTLADMNLLPILFFMDKAPESRTMLTRCKGLKDYFARHQARASVKDTIPPPFPGRSSWEVEA
jgi:glutathione S-transferase